MTHFENYNFGIFDSFNLTASRIITLNAVISRVSPARMSMARTLLLFRRALKSLLGPLSGLLVEK